MRPRRGERTTEGQWTIEHEAALFEAPTDVAAWRVAWSRRDSRGGHINERELRAVADAVRWATRTAANRRCRVLVQTDSAVTVGAIRKGRSSRPNLLRVCRRLAALTLAEEVALLVRWVPTDANWADRPSRGEACPGPCLA